LLHFGQRKRPTAARTGPADFASGWLAASRCVSRSRRRSAESTASSSKTNDMTFEHPLNVHRDQVELEVHQVIGARGVEIRSCSGLRDNPNGKTLLGHIGHREADSVNGDRTFASDVLRKLGG